RALQRLEDCSASLGWANVVALAEVHEHRAEDSRREVDPVEVVERLGNGSASFWKEPQVVVDLLVGIRVRQARRLQEPAQVWCSSRAAGHDVAAQRGRGDGERAALARAVDADAR